MKYLVSGITKTNKMVRRIGLRCMRYTLYKPRTTTPRHWLCCYLQTFNLWIKTSVLL